MTLSDVDISMPLSCVTKQRFGIISVSSLQLKDTLQKSDKCEKNSSHLSKLQPQQTCVTISEPGQCWPVASERVTKWTELLRVRGRMYGHGLSIGVIVWWPRSYNKRGGAGERLREGECHYLRHPSSSSSLSWASVLKESCVKMTRDAFWSREGQHWGSWPQKIWRLEISLGNLA